MGSEMEGMQRKQTGGRRESVRMWGDWPDVDFEEEAWRKESPLEHVRRVVGDLLSFIECLTGARSVPSPCNIAVISLHQLPNKA